MSAPEVSLLVLGLLVLASFAAGWVDAVVGGGGLIQLPALLIAFPAAAPVQLLATNKIASVFGTTVSAVTFVRRVRPDLRTALSVALPAFAGAAAGSLVASLIPREAFDPVILVVLLVVGAYTLLKPQLGQETLRRWDGRRHYAGAAVAGFAIGAYDGAIGPGTGSFLVFALVGLLGYGFLEASAKAKIANVATNLASLVVFVPQGAVMWKVGLCMAAANVLGGYLGARTAVARGSAFVRTVFVIVVGALVLRLGYDVWTRFAG